MYHDLQYHMMQLKTSTWKRILAQHRKKHHIKIKLNVSKVQYILSWI